MFTVIDRRHTNRLRTQHRSHVAKGRWHGRSARRIIIPCNHNPARFLTALCPQAAEIATTFAPPPRIRRCACHEPPEALRSRLPPLPSRGPVSPVSGRRACFSGRLRAFEVIKTHDMRGVSGRSRRTTTTAHSKANPSDPGSETEQITKQISSSPKTSNPRG